MPGEAPPRIYVLSYRAARGRRRVMRLWLKVPYSGLFNLMDVMARAMTTRQVLWFRIEAPQYVPDERRDELSRWPVALAASSLITGVDWSA